jgi:hypothetical protein
LVLTKITGIFFSIFLINSGIPYLLGRISLCAMALGKQWPNQTPCIELDYYI